MNADQIVQCVDILVACWPWAEWTDKTVDQWCDALAPVDINHARTVTTKARDTLDRPPSIAWFLAESKNEKERQSLTTHTPRAEPDPGEPLYRCLPCHDTGWIEVDSAGHGTVKPCQCGQRGSRRQPDPFEKPDPEGVAAILTECRRLLASSSSQQHNHRGPEPCPVCGGLVGTVGDQRGAAAP